MLTPVFFSLGTPDGTFLGQVSACDTRDWGGFLQPWDFEEPLKDLSKAPVHPIWEQGFAWSDGLADLLQDFPCYSYKLGSVGTSRERTLANSGLLSNFVAIRTLS